MPDDEPAVAIVHGDYRLDNLLVDADDRVRAVIDWEMATLGDPLTDLALLLVYDRLAEVAGSSAVADASLGARLSRTPTSSSSGTPRASGRDLDRMDFHLGLAYFKLAVILEGIHYRHLQGQTVGAGFDHIGDAVEPLLAAGLEPPALDRHRRDH